jgi:hypothetical protein
MRLLHESAKASTTARRLGMTRTLWIQAIPILALTFSANQALSQTAMATAPGKSLVSNYGKLPLAFEVNEGQTDARVQFLSHGRGYALFLTRDEAVLTLEKSRQNADREVRIGNPKLKTDDSQLDSVLRMKLVGANPGAAVIGAEELPGKTNYFIGSDPKKWRKDVPNYAKVRYQNVYPGVDLVYYGNQGGQLEYDFVVAPGTDPKAIALDVTADIAGRAKGAGRGSSLRIAANGDLVVKIHGGEVRFQKPVVYQEQGAARHSLDGRYVLRGKHDIGFEVASYDHSKPLVIDPTLSYSTFLGNQTVAAKSIAVDSAGNAYVTGSVGNFGSPVFPVTTGAYQTAAGSDQDAFITKLSADGSALVYSTYLGGNDRDQGSAIAVDSGGNAYVTGYTLSTNFPTTPGAFQVAMGGYYTAFVTKLNAAGSALVYSTYLDGSQLSEAFGIAVDSAGNAYVAGDTNSVNFPTTAGAFQVSLQGTFNAFVTKLNAAGSGAVYSTYLGGNDDDRPFGIALDSSNDAYVTGQTSSTNFPTTPGAFQTATGGGLDAFVTKLNAAGSALVYSTYLGGSNNDTGFGIAVDSSGNAYITGAALSTNFPTVNAFQPVVCANTCPSGGAFISKLNAAGSALVYSTYFGAGTGYGIAADSAGNAYVTGTVNVSTAFPPLVNPIPATCGACVSPNGIFVANLNAAGSALIYSTYFPDSATPTGIALDSAGNAYLTGSAQPTFPTTPGAYQTSAAFGAAYLAKVALATPPPSVGLSPDPMTFTVQNVGNTTDQYVTLTNTSANTFLYISTVTLGGANAGDYATGYNDCAGARQIPPAGTCSVDVVFTPTATGTRSATLTFTDTTDTLNAPSQQVVPLSGTAGPPAPQAVLSPNPLAFPSTTVGVSAATMPMTLSNPGNAALTITGISVTGTNASSFSQTNNCGASLAAGANCTITVTFTPASAASLTAAISVVDTATGSPQTATLTGTGTAPQAVLSPNPLAFPNTTEGVSAATMPMTLSNPGNAALSITGISVTGANASSFSQTNNCGASLAAAATCTITVTFTPASAASLTAAISVADNAAGSPQSAVVTGTGTVPLIPQAVLSPTSLAFPSTTINTSATPLPVTLSNPGNTALTITGITVTGANASSFGQTNNCGASLAAGATCTITVTFTPTSAASFAAAISVADNAAGSPQSVAVTGTGSAGTFVVAASTPSESVLPGGVAQFNIQVNPQGGSYSNLVTLSATGLPTGATVAFLPPSVTPGSAGAPSLMSVQTASGLARLAIPGQQRRTPVALLALLAGIPLLGFAAKRRRFRRSIGRWMCLAFAALAILPLLAISGCGGGYYGPAPKTYTLTVVGTSGSLQESTTVTLTVQ